MRSLKPHLIYASIISTSGKDCPTGSDLAGYKLTSKAEDYLFYQGRNGGSVLSRWVVSVQTVVKRADQEWLIIVL